MNKYIQKLENSIVVKTIRAGLINLMPILMIGAFALVLKTFPFNPYQTFISGIFNGLLVDMMDVVFSATFGMLSVYMTICLSRAYTRITAEKKASPIGITASALITFFILIGVNQESLSLDDTGAKSMFLAVVSGIGASALYVKVYHLMHKDKSSIMTAGADKDFNSALQAILPIAVIVTAVALFSSLTNQIFHVDSLRELTIMAFNKLFTDSRPTFGDGFLFVLLSSLLWFFGIHGSDVLEDVMQNVFAPGLEINQQAVMAGAEPTQVLSKQFFDCFVLMGGCGAAVSLLLAILIFSRNRSRKELGRASILPMLFNINEIIIFGLPIIYNPTMLLPFLLVPLTCYTTSYFAISSGLVPMITGSVEWTTPVILGGYLATNSVAGSLLQLFNITLGMMIYAPFIKKLDKVSEEENKKAYKDFLEFFREREDDFENKKIIERDDIYGIFARELTSDLRHLYKSGITMYYQPQYNHGGKCVGVEALLRIEHPVYGQIYPPIVIKLAKDGAFLFDIEKAVMLNVLDNLDAIHKKYGKDIHISFNITGTTVTDDKFIDFCDSVKKSVKGQNLCIEVTEQTALILNDDTTHKLQRLHDIGFKLAIDDFSMGHTSIVYLQNDLFDFIKLDGSLVKGLNTQNNCKEIIRTITRLADSLGITVIAEYVENEELRDSLHEIGCDYYQGWLYSPAVRL